MNERQWAVVGGLATIYWGLKIFYFVTGRAKRQGIPTHIPISEYAREVDVRLFLEVKYWLLIKRTGKGVSDDDAAAWFADAIAETSGARLKQMHAAILPGSISATTVREWKTRGNHVD